MTPAQLAQRECRNHVAGECIRHGKCRVAAGLKCECFDADVVPQERYGDGEVVKAVKAYRRNASDAARTCQCGAPLPSRKRLCAECRRKNRRQSERRARQGA